MILVVENIDLIKDKRLDINMVYSFFTDCYRHLAYRYSTLCGGHSSGWSSLKMRNLYRFPKITIIFIKEKYFIKKFLDSKYRDQYNIYMYLH